MGRQRSAVSLKPDQWSFSLSILKESGLSNSRLLKRNRVTTTKRPLLTGNQMSSSRIRLAKTLGGGLSRVQLPQVLDRGLSYLDTCERQLFLWQSHTRRGLGIQDRSEFVRREENFSGTTGEPKPRKLTETSPKHERNDV